MRYLSIVIICFILAGCQSAQESVDGSSPNNDTTMNSVTSTIENNAISATEQSEGWELLFDGKTKNGWHVFNNKTDGSAWVVSDGTLHLNPAKKQDWQTVGGGDIVTEKEFDNFHLTLDWKLDTAGNSGIMFYVKEDSKYEQAWHTGPEMQVLDNARHGDAKIIKHRAGDLYDLITSSPETVKQAGEWNHVEIISNRGSLEFQLNGTKILTTTLWDDNWRKLLAESKFNKWADFGTFKTGRIALQDHGDPVWYRNIKIKKL